MFHLTSIGPNLQKNILVLRKSCINVEALCVNHDLNTKRILLRTVTKEKRCAMRNFRRDSQFLASHRLNIIKKSDYIREKKTKAILSSIRSLED
nr:SJCHGC09763 protein [Schistosoma japonicum]